MKINAKIAGVFLAALPLLAAAAVSAEEVAVAQADAKPTSVGVTVDNNSDGAFAAELKGAEDLLKGLSHERKLTPEQSGAYLAKEMEKARKFFEYAKTTLIPHSLSLRRGMKDPDGLIAEGARMVEKNPGSWEGYDFSASGHYLKKDVDGAIKDFEKALAAAPGVQKDWYRYMLAGCYGYKKDTAKALELYEGIIAANENWLAVKSAYLGASRMLMGKDTAKAVNYFDKGMTLCTQGERDAMYKAGACNKFQGLENGPAACSGGAKS